MRADLKTSINLAAQAPYKLAFKTNVAGYALSEGDIDSSYKLLLETLLINPAFLPAQETIAVNRFVAKDFTCALKEFEQILRIDPDSKIGIWGKTLTLCRTGLQKEALDGLLEMSEDPLMSDVSSKILLKFFGIGPDSSISGTSIYNNLTTQIHDGKSKTAFDLLNVIGDSKEGARLKLVLVDALICRGERKTALIVMDKLLDTHPNYPGLLYKLAQTLMREGAFEQAKEHLQMLVDTNPIFHDSENLFADVVSAYADEIDKTELMELKNWLIDVLRDFITPKTLQEIAKETPKEPEPVKQPESSIVTETKQEEVFRFETKPVDAKWEADEPSQEFQTRHLERTRKILEEAKKILEETRHPEKQQEVIFFKEPTPPEEQRLDKEDQPSQTLFKEPALEPDFKIIDPKEEPLLEIEPVIIDAGPKRIVLPTSDEEPEPNIDRAWDLLSSGEAEEALMMFSKLIRAELYR